MASSESIVFGAFKGMGDLLSAAPVIASELNAGNEVNLLLFPQIRKFVDLLDFGPQGNRLRVIVLPVDGSLRSLREFSRHMARLSPSRLWVSPHAPAPASSWKIPLLFWIAKKLYWPNAKLAGADSERLSQLFDVRAPVDRLLPFAQRESIAYSMAWRRDLGEMLGSVRFRDSIQRHRRQPPAYDILIHPGAGATNRRWPNERFAEFVDCIPSSYEIAVVGLPEDVEAMKRVLPGNRTIQFLTGSLEDAISAIARARVALTMDSGNMFFANVLGVPAVAIFGASDPANVVALDGHILPIYEKRWPCQPCGRPQCSQPAVYCTASIGARKVADQVLGVLRRGEKNHVSAGERPVQ